MTNADEIRLFGLRAAADYVIAYGIEKVDLGENAWTHKYVAHWTGSQWEDAGKSNAITWDHKKYAQECLEENRRLLLDKLQDYKRDNEK